ncbi:ribonuclease P [Halobacteriales archaeon QS_4_69_31]|nr:MAG: ribonuclease P [Halobacteriales archaeon QS_4_69_31]
MSYEAVHAVPDGATAVDEFARVASEFGYEGVVVRNHGDALADFDPEAVAARHDIDVVAGVEVRAEDPSRASGFVGNHRDTKTVVAVHGGDPAVNRFAVEQPAVDVLAHPMAGDGDFNHVLAREAVENDVRVEFSFERVLRADGGRRVQALRDLRKLGEIVEEYDVPYVTSADPTSQRHLRSPRDLAAVADTVGFDADLVETGLAEWGRLAERNRFRDSETFVEQGVYLRGESTDAETDEGDFTDGEADDGE